MALQIGKKWTKRIKVTPEMTAAACGSGALEVFGTPFLAMLFENACCELLQGELDPGMTTVGTYLNFEHTSPTPVGAEVWAEVELTEIDRKAFTFRVEGFDEKGSIGGGTHGRFAVNGEKFLKKAQEKLQ